jgi:hypothetical protein
MYWGIMFSVERCEDWPSLAKQQEIPEHLRSSLSTGQRASLVGLGIVSAACLILKGELRLGQDGEKVSVSYESSGKGGGQRTASSESSTNGRIWRDHSGAQATTLLTIAETMLLARFDEVGQAWTSLLHALYLRLGKEPPYTSTYLQIAEAWT